MRFLLYGKIIAMRYPKWKQWKVLDSKGKPTNHWKKAAELSPEDRAEKNRIFREYWHANKARLKETRRRYYKRNKARLMAYQKEYVRRKRGERSSRDVINTHKQTFHEQ